MICQYNINFQQCTDDEQNVDWSLSAKAYPDLLSMPSFLAQQRQHYVSQSFSTTADPEQLRGKQLKAYSIVHEHFKGNTSTPLRLIVSGTAGTGKSYLIQCLKRLLNDSLCVTAPTGVAAFNIEGYTLHSLLALPVKGDFKDLEGKRLQTIQQSLTGVDYIIIDEMSMVGRKMLGQVDRRLRQVFPHRYEHCPDSITNYLLFDFELLYAGLKKCLVAVPACCLVTGVSCLQSWIWLCILLCLEENCLT